MARLSLARRRASLPVLLLAALVAASTIVPAAAESGGSAAVPSLSALFSSHVGFGDPEPVAPAVVVVRSAADRGPGTLRWAVAGSAPKHVVFATDLTIRLRSPVSVGSNTVVDGRGRRILVTGRGTTGLLLDRVSRVTVTSIVLRDFGDVAATGQNDPDDAISIRRSSDVWINDCDLSRAGDKLIGVTGGSRGITVSWNRFHHQEQVLQIGDQHAAAANRSQTVTVHHNYFDATGYRNPVVSYGRAHVFNNYYRDWRLYAVRSQRAAQVLFENNVLSGGRSRRATVTTPSDDGCNDARTRCDRRPGALWAVGNVVIGGPRLTFAAGGTVFRAADHYPYAPERADEGLARRVAASAGPGS